MSSEDVISSSTGSAEDAQLNAYETKLLADCESTIQECEKRIETGIKAIYELGHALLTETRDCIDKPIRRLRIIAEKGGNMENLTPIA